MAAPTNPSEVNWIYPLVDTLPTASAVWNGARLIVPGAAGARDIWYTCRKRRDDTYEWVQTGFHELGDLNLYTLGFPNVTDSVMSFNDGTRTFTIQPLAPATYFDIYVQGTRFRKNAAENVIITDTEGLWYIYYGLDGVLTASQTVWDFPTDAQVAYIYWDATNNQHIIFGAERHGLSLPYITHEYLHNTVGTRYANGLGITADTTGNGNNDTDAQVGIDDGLMYDEDIPLQITEGNPQPLAMPAEIPVFYRTGVTGAWRRYGPINFPVIPFDLSIPPPQVGSRLAYNQFVAGAWQLTQVGNSDHVAIWLYATNDVNYPIIAILGQREDNNVNQAKENNVVGDVLLGDMFFQEMKLIYRLIFQTNNGYANLVLARLRDIVDYRNVSNLPASNFVPTQHGSLGGLQNDDHSNVYPRVYGRNGELTDLADLNATYPPAVEYEFNYAFVAGFLTGDTSLVYQCIQTAPAVYHWVRAFKISEPPIFSWLLFNGALADTLNGGKITTTRLPVGSTDPGHQFKVDLKGIDPAVDLIIQIIYSHSTINETLDLDLNYVAVNQGENFNTKVAGAALNATPTTPGTAYERHSYIFVIPNADLEEDGSLECQHSRDTAGVDLGDTHIWEVRAYQVA